MRFSVVLIVCMSLLLVGRFAAAQSSARDNDIPSVYEVKSSETIFQIARRFNLSLRIIVDINGLRPPYDVRQGQVLILPQPLYHRVSAGESARSIARVHQVSFDELVVINRLSAPDYDVKIGQDLRLPGSLLIVDERFGADSQAGSFPADGATGGSSQGGQSVLSRDGLASGTTSGGDALTRPLQSSRQSTPELPVIGVDYIWPLEGDILRMFGDLDRGIANEGIDIAAEEGTEVRAVAGGVVAYSGNDLAAYGNLLLVRHANGFVSAYAHNRELFVKEGQQVAQGEVIALSGATGEVSEPRLHFELRRGRTPVDPLDFLQEQ